MRNLRLISSCIKTVTNRHYCHLPDKWPRQVLSAIQPTGNIHLGNYLGAIKKWVDLQFSEENTVIFAIADLHSITVPQNPKELHQSILTTAATLLASGISPEKSILFQQSAVPFHSQLCWVLSTMATMARLSHLPQYKEKSQLFKDVPVGIFLYPILQAADIMLYRGTHIPVGEDQIHHINLVNHLIQTFNKRFGESFPKINAIIDESSGKIKSLVDPSKKMSKSDKNSRASITLLDTPEEILSKCKRSLTDFNSKITFEPEERPGVTNLLLIHAGLTGKSPADLVEEFKNLDTGQYKIVLADVIIEYFKPIRKKILEYLNSPEYLIDELDIGAKKANEIAEKTIRDVNSQMGFDLLGFPAKNMHSAQSAI